MTIGRGETSIIGIEGMGCDHCRKTIEQELRLLEGVIQIVVDLEKKQAEVNFDPGRVSLDQIKNRITELGYEA